jgi:hypothetical protein
MKSANSSGRAVPFYTFIYFPCSLLSLCPATAAAVAAAACYPAIDNFHSIFRTIHPGCLFLLLIGAQ